MPKRRWHILQISDVLDEELASALSQDVDVIGWVPKRQTGRALFGGTPHSVSRASGWRRAEYPALRGFARAPRWLNRFYLRRLSRWIAAAASSEHDVLLCTTPYFAEVAERWKGPVVYWLTDLIAQYGSAKGIDVPALDYRMCKAATLVCPNSNRLSAYLMQQECDPEKILILPNATREKNVLPVPLREAARLPSLAGDARPTAGVIGNLAGNMDWNILEACIRATPWLRWVFVGPVTMLIPDPRQASARMRVQHMENTLFVGKKPYGELASYARSFDVAVLPYLRCEPTYSGSSTRFYEHQAACRPMIATCGFEELTRKQPLVQLFDTPEEAVRLLEQLRTSGFEDGYTEARWLASQHGTWEQRASDLQAALNGKLHRTKAIQPAPASHFVAQPS